MKRLMVLVVALCAGVTPMGALAQGSERPTYEKPLSAQAVRDIQALLRARGYEPVAAALHERATAEVGRRTTDAVQTQLRRSGYYRGPVDGVWGPDTRLGLEHFQRDRRLPVTGRPSRETLAALGLNPGRYMSGSSSPRSESDRLNHRELERVERSGQF